jgi:hypothetical protein
MCLDSSYQRTEGKGLALGLMQSLVKVGLFCTCMSLLAYTLQVTMAKEEITVPFEINCAVTLISASSLL